MLNAEELVTVVVPAYNAEDTLDATLISVRKQSYRNLEVFVVVDGATDTTEAVARLHAGQDSRISVITTPNRGLVSSRNTGARAGTGSFIAPLDADDIWHPEKLRKQVSEFALGGPETGFVYTLFRRIDQWGYVIRDGAHTCWSGRIFEASLLYNCVGNGSSILIRRSAFEEAGGYCEELNRKGCEDYLLQLVVSRDWAVRVVPEYLTGYRFDRRSMSRNFLRMAGARLKMLEIIERNHPDLPGGLLELARAHAITERAMALAREGRLGSAASEFSRATRLCFLQSFAYLAYRLRDFCYRVLRNINAKTRPRKPLKFEDIDPATRFGIAYSPRRSRTMQRLLKGSSTPTT